MPKIGLVAFLFLIAGSSYAQQNYFVLIRTDNNQPFYARIGARAFSSSAQGHLIIPQLRDSTYIITIGFPKNLFPERDFSFTIKKNDGEFQLKDLGEKGWGLFNPQTMELKMPVRIDTADIRFRPEGVKKDDAFSRLMAGVVSDTAVMYNTYAQEDAGKKDTAQRAIAISQQPGTVPVSGAQTATSQTPAPQTTVNQTSSPRPGKLDSSARFSNSGVNTRFDTRSDSSFKPTPPILNTGAKTDSAIAGTVTTAPGVSGGTASSGVTSAPGGTGGTAHPAAFVPRAANRHKGVFIEKLGEQKTAAMWKLTYADHANGRPVDTILIVIPVDSGAQLAETAPKGAATDPGAKNKKSPPAVINSDCKAFAGDYDVDKLRLKMLASPKDEDKILIAKKILKTKCFSSPQIRTLCEVFTADAGKYRLLEAAYPFVWDDRFRGLSDVLTDPSYTSRFRTMTGQ